MGGGRVWDGNFWVRGLVCSLHEKKFAHFQKVKYIPGIALQYVTSKKIDQDWGNRSNQSNQYEVKTSKINKIYHNSITNVSNR